MRIGLATTTIEPSFNRGHLDGIGVYTKALLDNLPSAQCQVSGLAFPSLTNRKSPAAPLLHGGAMPHSFALLTMRDLVTPRSIRVHLPVDLFHATDYRAVRLQCPVVATLHDAVALQYPQWCNPRMRRLKNWVLRNAASKADHVISLSASAIPEIVTYFGVDEKRISVVPCGISEHWLQSPPQADVTATLQQFNLEAGYFLFVGTLQPRKNVDRILAAYLNLPPHVRRARQCVIVGRPGWRCDATIAQMRSAAAQGERIVWLNRIDSETTLRQLYSAAGVFVFPSLHEGFGIPLTEAFASKVPVITSNTTSLPEVSQGAALEINPLSVAEIADAMRELVQNEGLRQRCIDAGLTRVAELTWQRTAHMTAAVYRKVLAA
jgi:glycosyltransferase involved in cell wall biosynthesis